MAMKMIAGLDIGNGYVKSSVMGHGTGMTDIDIPSCVVHRIPKDGEVRKVLPNEIADEMANLFGMMDASFDSPLIPDKARFLVGARAVNSGREPMEFDVNAVKSKAKQPLTAQLALVCIAGKALQDAYVTAGNKLPDKTVSVDVVAAAMALPISEFKDMRKEYVKGYMDSVHAVTFHNFEKDIRVEIRFMDVMVNAEGAAAQYGIVSKGPDMIEAMLQDIRLNGVPLEGYTAADIMNASSTLGVDIGEGTVNFPVFINGKFSTDASDTLNKGYGQVMEGAVQALKIYKSRKELTEFLNNPTQNPDSIMYKKRYAPVQKVVDAEISEFVDSVATKFAKVMNQVGGRIEVIYVYGGGATPMQRELFKRLLDILRNIEGEEIVTPILYMDSRYSRNLNREGLFAMAEAMAANSGKK